MTTSFRKKCKRKLAAKSERVHVDSPHLVPVGRVSITDPREVGKPGRVDEDIEFLESFECGLDSAFVSQVASQWFHAIW